MPTRYGAEGGVGRGGAALLWFNADLADTTSRLGLVALGADGRGAVDTLTVRVSDKSGRGALGARFTALAASDNLLALGAGRAGLALLALRPAGQGFLRSDTIAFATLARQVGIGDTTITALHCVFNSKAQCPVDTLDRLAFKPDSLDSVTALAWLPISASGDSAILLVGTDHGLLRARTRAGALDGGSLARVDLGGETSKPILSVSADSAGAKVWVATANHILYSGDGGLSFHIPPPAPAQGLRPDSLFLGFHQPPQAAFAGDTSYLNLAMDAPGLAVFTGDSLQATAGSDPYSLALLDLPDSLPVARGVTAITALARVASGPRSALVAGTDTRGIFYRPQSPGQAGPWRNLTRQRVVRGGLGEVITFPTVFSAARGEKVGLGYRLDRDAKVTITIYDYQMHKVRTLARDRPRQGGKSRSEDPAEDAWDGRDASGRMVSVGVYYILVETDKGGKAWGKAIAAGGR